MPPQPSTRMPALLSMSKTKLMLQTMLTMKDMKKRRSRCGRG